MIKSILLSVDLNHPSSWSKALPQAVALAKADGAEIHILTVIPDYGMAMVADQFPAGFADKASAVSSEALKQLVADHIPSEIKTSTHVQHGTIYKSIIKAANNAGCDLIVMASHRSEMKDYLLGPNAARVVRHAKQSVFVVREE